MCRASRLFDPLKHPFPFEEPDVIVQ